MRSTTAFAITLVLFGSSYAIPWPVGENGPDSLNSYSLMTTYGEMMLTPVLYETQSPVLMRQEVRG
jgi:hypothetical protein